MHDAKPILPGLYRHYKGQEYSVVGIARHSETMEELVVYRQEYGEHGLWVRPKPMFAETVTIAGQPTERFAKVSAAGTATRAAASNLFADLPQSMPAEVMQTILQADAVRIERIVSHGHHSAADFWYDQAEHEWVVLLSGAARLQLEDRMLALHPGDFLNIPARTKHRVAWTTPHEPTVWLAVWYGARE